MNESCVKQTICTLHRVQFGLVFFKITFSFSFFAFCLLLFAVGFRLYSFRFILLFFILRLLFSYGALFHFSFGWIMFRSICTTPKNKIDDTTCVGWLSTVYPPHSSWEIFNEEPHQSLLKQLLYAGEQKYQTFQTKCNYNKTKQCHEKKKKKRLLCSVFHYWNGYGNNHHATEVNLLAFCLAQLSFSRFFFSFNSLGRFLTFSGN